MRTLFSLTIPHNPSIDLTTHPSQIAPHYHKIFSQNSFNSNFHGTTNFTNTKLFLNARENVIVIKPNPVMIISF